MIELASPRVAFIASNWPAAVVSSRVGPFLPQQVRQDHQLVVVYPYLVVGLEDGNDLLRKQLVHLQVGVEIRAFVFRQRRKIVEQRPEHRIGKAIVVLVIDLLVGEDREDLEVLFGRMCCRQLVPVFLGKIRHTDPHLPCQVASLCARVLKITLDS